MTTFNLDDDTSLSLTRTTSPWLSDGMEIAIEDHDGDPVSSVTLDAVGRAKLREFLDTFDDEVADCSQCRMPMHRPDAPNGGHKMSCTYGETRRTRLTIPATLKEEK